MRMLGAKQTLWLLLGILVSSALWLLNIEITYRRNVRNLPADFEPHRHVITRVWRT
jgi:hypothetical protein